MLSGIEPLLKMMDEYTAKVIRKRIHVYGSVQGVGFRYRAKHAAGAEGATGWVKNEEDGSVTMEIQATQAQIDRVFMNISKGTWIRIEQMDAKTIPCEQGEYGFDIRETSDFFGFWHR